MRLRTDGEKLSILLAEDDPATGILARLNLEKLGLDVRMATDGKEALALWRTGRHKAVLLDFNMPRMSGLDVARAIREDEGKEDIGHTMIILITAKPLDHLEEVQTRGVVDLMLPKPVDYSELYNRLEDLFPGRGAGHDSPSPKERSGDTVYEGEPLDLKELEENVGAEGLGDILSIFLRQAEKYIGEIEEAFSRNDGLLTSQIAHKLKGSSAQFTAKGMVAPAEYLQRNCAQGDLDDEAASKLEILKREMDKIKSYVKEIPELQAGR